MFLYKLLYMFWVVPPPTIRNAYNCISNSSAIAEGSSNGLTVARCCNYSCMCSWWWVEVPPETCRAVYRNI